MLLATRRLEVQQAEQEVQELQLPPLQYESHRCWCCLPFKPREAVLRWLMSQRVSLVSRWCVLHLQVRPLRCAVATLPLRLAPPLQTVLPLQAAQLRKRRLLIGSCSFAALPCSCWLAWAVCLATLRCCPGAQRHMQAAPQLQAAVQLQALEQVQQQH